MAKATKKSMEKHKELDAKLKEDQSPQNIVLKVGNENQVIVTILSNIHNQLVQLNRQMLEMNFYCSFMAPEEHRKTLEG